MSHFPPQAFPLRRGRLGNRPGKRSRTLICELLEDRRVLSAALPQIELFGISPALFVQNQGQWADEAVRFLHNGSGANVAMTDDGIDFQMLRSVPMAAAEPADGPLPDFVQDGYPSDDYTTELRQFSVSFVDANSTVPVGLNPADTVFNYFKGEEANWRSEVPGYEIVAYEGLYEGIDLQAWGLRSRLKYEFHVAPGADWTQIAVRYEGIDGLSVRNDGSLAVDLGEAWGELTDDAPYIYQVIEGQEVEITGRFALVDSHTYTFNVTGWYDVSLPLIIDPALAWSKYIGGSSSDVGYGIAADAYGNALVTGWTLSGVFPGANNARHGYYDAFVAKVSASGVLQWATYLGGSEYDQGHSVVVDAAGNALVTGSTYSSDFAGANNAYSSSYDAFVAKVSTNGALLWATYLGGSNTDRASGIAVDIAGNALVTGLTQSTDFAGATYLYPSGGRTSFLAKISSDGVFQWNINLGGRGFDEGLGVAVDTEGNALVTGRTRSTDFVGANNTHHGGNYDAFVAKVSGNGVLQWSTYLGGSNDDFGDGIAIDAAGNALVTGWTYSQDFPHRINEFPGGSSAFVAKIAPRVFSWSDLTRGVNEVVWCGTPGPVYDLSGDWVPIVGGDDDTSFPSTVAMAREYGAGRVMVFGHTQGIFTIFDALDNAVFLENVTRWLNADGGRQVRYTSGHGEWAEHPSKLEARLANEGYTFTPLPGTITADELAMTSVLFVARARQDFTQDEIELVRQFVEDGGGLWMTATAWAWEPYNRPKTLEEFPMMQLAAPYEMRWLRSYIGDPTNNYSCPYVSPVFHTFYPDVPSISITSALNTIRAAHAAHPTDLPAALESNASLRLSFISHSAHWP